MWERRILESGPCGAEGEEKARYPQGLRGTVDILILSRSATMGSAHCPIMANLLFNGIGGIAFFVMVFTTTTC